MVMSNVDYLSMVMRWAGRQTDERLQAPDGRQTDQKISPKLWRERPLNTYDTRSYVDLSPRPQSTRQHRHCPIFTAFVDVFMFRWTKAIPMAN